MFSRHVKCHFYLIFGFGLAIVDSARHRWTPSWSLVADLDWYQGSKLVKNHQKVDFWGQKHSPVWAKTIKNTIFGVFSCFYPKKSKTIKPDRYWSTTLSMMWDRSKSRKKSLKMSFFTIFDHFWWLWPYKDPVGTHGGSQKQVLGSFLT